MDVIELITKNIPSSINKYQNASIAVPGGTSPINIFIELLNAPRLCVKPTTINNLLEKHWAPRAPGLPRPFVCKKFRIFGGHLGGKIRWKIRFVKSVRQIRRTFWRGRIYDVGRNFGFS